MKTFFFLFPFFHVPLRLFLLSFFPFSSTPLKFSRQLCIMDTGRVHHRDTARAVRVTKLGCSSGTRKFLTRGLLLISTRYTPVSLVILLCPLAEISIGVSWKQKQTWHPFERAEGILVNNSDRAEIFPGNVCPCNSNARYFTGNRKEEYYHQRDTHPGQPLSVGEKWRGWKRSLKLPNCRIRRDQSET